MAKEKPPETTEKAIEKLISVPGNHDCRNDPKSICPVTLAASEDLIFVANRNYPYCPYYVPFGYGGYCNYPARKEIYKKYGV